MEDNKEKLDLLLACYLGKFHPIEQVKLRDWGFGNVLQGILSSAENYVDGINSGEALKRMASRYDRIKRAYEELPFESMDWEDPDFAPLFVVRDLLPILGNSIDKLILNKNEDPNQEIQSIVEKIMYATGQCYEDRIINLSRGLTQH